MAANELEGLPSELRCFSRERIGAYTYKVVEDDPHGQYPFLYVILGIDKVVLIDTGCGTRCNYRAYLDLFVNYQNLPYLVINTHIHFDHVGGNHLFSGKDGCLGIIMGGYDKQFSSNVELNSLAMAHASAKVLPFKVTRWAEHGELIYLNDRNPVKECSLEILWTPGHTPDSIAIYSHWENRLFVGDNLYPFSAVHLDCLGSNVADYLITLEKLIQFCNQIEGNKKKEIDCKEDSESLKTMESFPAGAAEIENEEKSKVIPSSSKVEEEKKERKSVATEPTQETDDIEKSVKEANRLAMEEFCSMIGQTVRIANASFHVESLMQLCDWSVQQAVNMYLTDPESLPAICPPRKGGDDDQKASFVPLPEALTAKSVGESKEWVRFLPETRISCGHIEANLSVDALHKMHKLMHAVHNFELMPVRIDGEYGEFNQDGLSMMMPLSTEWVKGAGIRFHPLAASEAKDSSHAKKDEEATKPEPEKVPDDSSKLNTSDDELQQALLMSTETEVDEKNQETKKEEESENKNEGDSDEELRAALALSKIV